MSKKTVSPPYLKFFPITYPHLLALLLSFILPSPALSKGITIIQCWDEQGKSYISSTPCPKKHQAKKEPVNKTIHLPLHPKGLPKKQYWIATILNETLSLYFLIDTGANGVSIPKDVFEHLVKKGKISQKDFIRMATFTIADGSKIKEAIYRLKTLQIGPITLKNVHVSVMSKKGTTPLLGTPILEALGSWKIDIPKKSLIITQNANSKRQSNVRTVNNNDTSQACIMLYRNFATHVNAIKRLVRYQKQDLQNVERLQESVEKSDLELSKKSEKTNFSSKSSYRHWKRQLKEFNAEKENFYNQVEQFRKNTNTRRNLYSRYRKKVVRHVEEYNTRCPGRAFQDHNGQWQTMVGIAIPDFE
ncbi:retroviral-like aspartic protease family protein [Magnetococcales bacterium HHB-1]